MHQPGAAVADRTAGPNGTCERASAAEIGEGPGALAQLYDRHAAVVLSLCRGRLGIAGIDEADDACQETFIRAFRRIHEANGPRDDGGARRWLYAIARHVCNERSRARRRRARHEMIARTNHAGELQSRDAVDAAGYLTERSELLDRLTAAIAQLPHRERLALHLHSLEQDPVRAAGEAMNISRSSYYKLLSRAKDLLARQLFAHINE